MEEYIYQVTRAHGQELRMLGEKDLEQLIAAKDFGEALRLLTDKGWGQSEGIRTSDRASQENADAIVNAESRSIWEFISDLLDDTAPFNVFLIKNDYHNLKAAIKLKYSGEAGVERERYFMPGGTVEPDKIEKAVEENDYSLLPDEMGIAGREAYDALVHTANGQNCDMIIDRATLEAIDLAGREAKSELLREYAKITVDQANIKAAVRCCVMKKGYDFIVRAIAPCGSLDTGELVRAAAQGIDSVYEYLGKTDYSGAVESLKKSLADFERWCDNQLIEMIKPQKANFFGIEPLAAYILARENEIKMVRLILSAKINGFAPEMLRERLRVTYV